MSGKRIKHFIVTRFFPKQNRNYPHNVLDVEFLQKQLVLAKNNFFVSLANQTNTNFEIVVITNPKIGVDGGGVSISLCSRR